MPATYAGYVCGKLLQPHTTVPPASSPLQLYASRPPLLYELKRAGH